MKRIYKVTLGTKMTVGAGLLAGGLACFAGEDFPPRSSLDGMYTKEQSLRGMAIYAGNCTTCHGTALEGRGQAPALAGPEFNANWDEMTIADLFEKIQLAMPANAPGRLSSAQTADIVAFILGFNKLPTSTQELPSDADALRGVLIQLQDGNIR